MTEGFVPKLDVKIDTSQTDLYVSSNLAYSLDIYKLLSPDGSKIIFRTSCYTADIGQISYDLYTMNADGTGKTKLNNEPGMWGSISWSPDGRIIIVYGAKDDEGILSMDADGSNITKLFSYERPGDKHGHCSIDGLQWLHDGSKLLFKRGNTLYIVDANGSNLSEFLADKEIWDIACSPASNRIAYVYNRRLYVADIDGTNAVQLTERNIIILLKSIIWSPDGTRLAFQSTENNYIYSVNADGNELTKLFKIEEIAEHDDDGTPLAWAPDSSRIAFRRLDEEAGQVGTWAIDADGSNLAKLSDNVSYSLAWSPDGTKIATVNNGGSLYIMNADGSNETPLGNLPFGYFYWLPDSSAIIISRQTHVDDYKPR